MYQTLISNLKSISDFKTLELFKRQQLQFTQESIFETQLRIIEAQVIKPNVVVIISSKNAFLINTDKKIVESISTFLETQNKRWMLLSYNYFEGLHMLMTKSFAEDKIYMIDEETRKPIQILRSYKRIQSKCKLEKQGLLVLGEIGYIQILKNGQLSEPYPTKIYDSITCLQTTKHQNSEIMYVQSKTLRFGIVKRFKFQENIKEEYNCNFHITCISEIEKDQILVGGLKMSIINRKTKQCFWTLNSFGIYQYIKYNFKPKNANFQLLYKSPESTIFGFSQSDKTLFEIVIDPEQQIHQILKIETQDNAIKMLCIMKQGQKYQLKLYNYQV